jgi:hypothetical protein
LKRFRAKLFFHGKSQTTANHKPRQITNHGKSQTTANLESVVMRVCAVCHFGLQAGGMHVAQPSAALVLAFSSTDVHGKDGILAQIATMSAIKHMPMASAYCNVCRSCTWLCRDDADINEACLEFMHIWRSTEQIRASLAVMHRQGMPLMQSYSQHTHC